MTAMETIRERDDAFFEGLVSLFYPEILLICRADNRNWGEWNIPFRIDGGTISALITRDIGRTHTDIVFDCRIDTIHAFDCYGYVEFHHRAHRYSDYSVLGELLIAHRAEMGSIHTNRRVWMDEDDIAFVSEFSPQEEKQIQLWFDDFTYRATLARLSI